MKGDETMTTTKNADVITKLSLFVNLYFYYYHHHHYHYHHHHHKNNNLHYQPSQGAISIGVLFCFHQPRHVNTQDIIPLFFQL